MKKNPVILAVAALAAGYLLLASGCRTSELDHYRMEWDDSQKAVILSRDGKFLMSHSELASFAKMTARFKDNQTLEWFSDLDLEKGSVHVTINDMYYIDKNGDMIFDQAMRGTERKDNLEEFFRYKDKWMRGETISPSHREIWSAELNGIGPVHFHDGAWVPGERPAAKPVPSAVPKNK